MITFERLTFFLSTEGYDTSSETSPTQRSKNLFPSKCACKRTTALMLLQVSVTHNTRAMQNKTSKRPRILLTLSLSRSREFCPCFSAGRGEPRVWRDSQPVHVFQLRAVVVFCVCFFCCWLEEEPCFGRVARAIVVREREILLAGVCVGAFSRA